MSDLSTEKNSLKINVLHDPVWCQATARLQPTHFSMLCGSETPSSARHKTLSFVAWDAKQDRLHEIVHLGNRTLPDRLIR